MLFSYSAKSREGGVVEGTMEAVDRFSLSRDLKSRGLSPLSIGEQGISFSARIDKFLNQFSKVSVAEQIILTKNLSGMLKAGLSLYRALLVLQKQTKNATLNKILVSIATDINGGGTLSSGMKKFPKVFSGVFVSMVHSGEESGGLPRTLSEIGITLKKTYDLNKKIKGALIYPSVILFAIFAIGILMMIYVVPTLTATFKDVGMELPASTQFIIFISDSLKDHFLLFATAMAAFIGSFVAFAKLKSTQKLVTNIWPGFPTDLMSVAIVLATQSKGVILCHDWMYEGRMFFIDKLITMGAKITLADPHRVLVYGQNKLRGKELETPDIRAGMALVVAALVARGRSVINQAELIERGYEDVVMKLRGLGADIERVEV